MQSIKPRNQAALWIALFISAVALIFAWPIVIKLLSQVVWGYLLMALALPLARVMEKKYSQGLSATLSLTALTLTLILLLLILLPLLFKQGQQMAALVPTLMENGQRVIASVEDYLVKHGIASDGQPLLKLDDKLMQWLESLFPTVLKKAGNVADALSVILPAPILAFYFLKDRDSIACHMSMWVPLKYRQSAVAAAREMKREISGFVRGQLLISVMVGGLTAIGLMIVQVPACLLLGILMGILELIPYVGPILGAIPVVMFALPGGFARVAWGLAVVIVVQQLESGLIAPRMMSGATNLHPVLVLLSISAGGIVGGVMGMLLALPIVLSLRGAFRVLRLQNAAPLKSSFRTEK